VINLAGHVRNQAGQDSVQPIWVSAGSQPDIGIIGEIAVWRAPTASTPVTDDQPEQDSCKQPRPSGNTTSTEVSQAPSSAGMKSERATVLDPREIAGQKIDSACPNHPRSARARRRPAPGCSSAVAQSWRVEEPDTSGQFQLLLPTIAECGSS